MSSNDRSPSRRPLLLRPGQQTVMDAWDVRIALLATAADTGGRCSILEYVSPPTGLGPPLHLHHETEESFLILEGTLQVRVGDETLAAAPGTFIHVPPEVPHAFWNAGPEPARFIVTFCPGGMEQYFVDLFELAQDHPTPTRDIRPMIEKIGGIYDMIVVGPPPGTPSMGGSVST